MTSPIAHRPSPQRLLGVDLDEAALERDAVRLEAEVLGVRGDADRDEQDVGLERRPSSPPPAAGSTVIDDLVAGVLRARQLVADAAA